MWCELENHLFFQSIHSAKCPLLYSSNHPGAKYVVRYGTPKQQRRPLPSLLYKSFLYAKPFILCRGCPERHQASSFANLPFGHGPRSCIGKMWWLIAIGIPPYFVGSYPVVSTMMQGATEQCCRSGSEPSASFCSIFL